MVALGKTKDGKAFNCQSPSNLTKLREEDLYEELPFVLNIRAPAIATTLAKGEVLEMLDMQECIRSSKNNPTKDRKMTLEDDFLKFGDDLVDNRYHAIYTCCLLY
jgi:hypothetical protein